MQKVEIAAYVINELGKKRNQSDVILSLCEKTGIKWADAEQIVREVRADNEPEIVAWKNPVLILLSALLLFFGIGLALVLLFEPQRLLIETGMFLGGIVGLWNILTQYLKAR
jgi:hypothetical protein